MTWIIQGYQDNDLEHLDPLYASLDDQYDAILADPTHSAQDATVSLAYSALEDLASQLLEEFSTLENKTLSVSLVGFGDENSAGISLSVHIATNTEK